MAPKRAHFAWLVRALIALLFLIPFLIGQSSDLTTHPQCPWIEAEQYYPENRIETEKEPNDVISPFLITVSPLFPNCDSTAERPKGKGEGQHAEEEGTEFWPPLLGYRLKVTDTLVAVFTCLLFIATWLLWRSTAALVNDARDATKTQTENMKASIAEAVRSASAMERVADRSAESVTSIRERTAMQMRAYLSVIAGSAAYQERQKNIRFEGMPNLFNAGQTPAHKVRYWAKAAILPIPFPEHFAFVNGNEEFTEHAAVLAPHQGFILNRFLEEFVRDEDVPVIKLGAVKAFYIWGTVKYDDIFGAEHYTNFAQWMRWFGEGNQERSMLYYCSRHNDAD